MNYTKEYCENEIEKWKERLAELNKLEVGKWYTEDKFLLFNFKRSDGNGGVIGYGFWEGDWCNDEQSWIREDETKLRLATNEEVEEALTKEAKKRGFKEGVDVGEFNGIFGKNEILVSNNYRHSNITDFFYMGGVCILNNGIWAEIVEETPEYTMEELTEKLGHTFKIKK